jgi:hypothetical protein
MRLIAESYIKNIAALPEILRAELKQKIAVFRLGPKQILTARMK